MTIASETSRVNLVGDGVNDTFTFTFEIYVKTDLLVYVDNVLQDVDVEYTVADDSIENPDGGDIVFGAEYIPALAAVVSIILNLPYTQLIDYVEASKFPAETHERGLDRLIKIAQQLKERVTRQPVLLESSQYSDLTLPDPVANEYLAWKDDLSGLKNVVLASEGDLTVTDFIKTLLDDADVGAAQTTLGVNINKISIPPAAFVPSADTYDWTLTIGYLKNRTVTTIQHFYAPVILPHGVTVTKLTLFGYRDDALSEFMAVLERTDRETNSNSLATVIADWTDGLNSKYDNSISNATIDNANYNYTLTLAINPNDDVGDVYFTGALIEF